MSTSTVPGDKADLVAILEQSRHNNAIDGVTGLLWSDGVRFVQVIEGPSVSVVSTYERISNDRRHRDILLQHDIAVLERQFGGWTMAHRRASDPVDAYDALVRRLLGRASDDVKRAFLSLMAAESLC